MGQRLNLEVQINGNVLANSYYHWSAYSTSALSIAADCISYYERNLKGKYEGVELAVRTLLMFDETHASSAGLTTESLEFMKKNFKNVEWPTVVSRNEGLVGCVEEEIEQTRQWEEGRVIIDLTNESVYTDIYWSQYVEDEESRFEEGYSLLCNLEYSKIDFSKIPFDKIDSVLSFMSQNWQFLNHIDDDICITDLIE